MNWQPISDAPKDGTKVDLWAKRWIASTDSFIHTRATDCFWVKEDFMGNSPARWANLPSEWCATHFMLLPEPPQ
jgi:hypothetical protein